MKTLSTASIVTMIGVATLVAASYSYAKDREKGRGTGPTVYVTSQDLYYDSIVVVDSLPPNGNFQQLIPDMSGALSTEFGPGEPGHLGGRWWIDLDENGEMDEGDKYFLCPLLGPGRDTL